MSLFFGRTYSKRFSKICCKNKKNIINIWFLAVNYKHGRRWETRIIGGGDDGGAGENRGNFLWHWINFLFKKTCFIFPSYLPQFCNVNFSIVRKTTTTTTKKTRKYCLVWHWRINFQHHLINKLILLSITQVKFKIENIKHACVKYKILAFF